MVGSGRTVRGSVSRVTYTETTAITIVVIRTEADRKTWAPVGTVTTVVSTTLSLSSVGK